MLLKEYGKQLLARRFGVPERFIHEEFPLGAAKFDVIAYPSIGFKRGKKIAVECGRTKSSIEKCYHHFSDALEFVDFIIWIPYDTFLAPFIDLFHSALNDLVFIPAYFESPGREFLQAQDSPMKDTIVALFMSKKGRFQQVDEILAKHPHPVRRYVLRSTSV